MKLQIKTNYKLSINRDNPYHFVVVGCGGNGSFLVRDLARLISIRNADWDKQTNGRYSPHRLTVIDGDLVEEKNIRRQNFISSDIGHNKAEILASRYSASFNMEISCLPRYITDIDDFDGIVRSQHGIPVIIGCVDNNATRSIMAGLMQRYDDNRRTTVWLDGGNEEYSGQVALGVVGTSVNLNNFTDEQLKVRGSRTLAFNTPTVTQVYPEILDVSDKRPDEMSCDDRAVSAPQCILTNITVATIMLSFCNHLINMPEVGLESWMVTFDVRKINFNTIFTNKQSLEEGLNNPIWKKPTLKIDKESNGETIDISGIDIVEPNDSPVEADTVVPF